MVSTGLYIYIEVFWMLQRSHRFIVVCGVTAPGRAWRHRTDEQRQLSQPKLARCKVVFWNIDLWMLRVKKQCGYGSIPINTIFRGMNIHKSQLFWCSPGVQGFDTPVNYSLLCAFLIQTPNARLTATFLCLQNMCQSQLDGFQPYCYRLVNIQKTMENHHF